MSDTIDLQVKNTDKGKTTEPENERVRQHRIRRANREIAVQTQQIIILKNRIGINETEIERLKEENKRLSNKVRKFDKGKKVFVRDLEALQAYKFDKPDVDKLIRKVEGLENKVKKLKSELTEEKNKPQIVEEV